MDPNTAIEIAKAGAPILQSSLSGIVGAILGTLFLRRTTTVTECEKLKAGKFSEVTDKLLAEGKMSYLELYRCNNFLKIAQLADETLSQDATDSTAGAHTEYDFDWFIRFFDAAGYISNQEMQQLWAKVLAGEISNHGLFSFRTLETLRNLNQKEAKLFQTISKFVLTEQTGIKFVLSMFDDAAVDINEAYGIRRQEFIVLEDCGLLNSIRSDNRISLNVYPSGIWNDDIILVVKYKRSDGMLLSYKYSCYTLTPAACQLLTVLQPVCDNDYLLKAGIELNKKYSSNLMVTAHRIIDNRLDSSKYDESVDILSGAQNI